VELFESGTLSSLLVILLYISTLYRKKWIVIPYVLFCEGGDTDQSPQYVLKTRKAVI
jgi:hypothetical protein